MSALERAAMAARDTYGVSCGETWVAWSKADPQKRAEWLAIARAVLMAVREPGSAIVEAAYDAPNEIDVWQIIIMRTCFSFANCFTSLAILDIFSY